MSISQSFSSDQSMVIQLEVVADDQQPADMADVDEVGRSLFDQLEQSGQTIEAASTGTKGGGGLLFNILLTVPPFLHDNKDWLLASIPPVLDRLLIARDRRAEQEKEKRPPLKITLEVKGKPIIIEAKDPKDVANLIGQLQINQNDQVKMKVHVPKKKRHG